MTGILFNRVKYVPAAQFTREQVSADLPLAKGGVRSVPAELGTTRPVVREKTPMRREHPEALSSSLPGLNSQLPVDGPIRN